MNVKKAKALRRQIFTEVGIHGPRMYVARRHERKQRLIDVGGGQMLDQTPLTIELSPGTPHRKYRQAKRGRV